MPAGGDTPALAPMQTRAKRRLTVVQNVSDDDGASPPEGDVPARSVRRRLSAPRLATKGADVIQESPSPARAPEPAKREPKAAFQITLQARPSRQVDLDDEEDDEDPRGDSAAPRRSSVGLPMTHGTPCGPSGGEGGENSWAERTDLRHLKVRVDHHTRPIWVCPDGRIVFEAFHPKAPEVEDFLIAIAEPVSRPETIHEYQITMLSLNAAVSTGIEVDQIVRLLERLSKNELDDNFLSFVREQGRSIGRLKLVLRNNRHFLESVDPLLLQRLCMDSDIAESLIHGGAEEAPDAGEQEGGSSGAAGAAGAGGVGAFGGAGAGSMAAACAEINSLRVEAVKSAAHRLQLPLLQEYEFTQDNSERNPELKAVLRSTASLRPYQQRALSKMFAIDGVAKSGIVVLPCGAGKTLTGISAACRIRRRTLVLTTTAVAVDQWRRQFQQYTTIPPEDVYMLTADHKTPIVDAARRACVLVSTYSMMGYSGKRGVGTDFILSQIQQLEWGLLVVDEVQVMPARTFRTVATTVKAHCLLGLTATLVREDNLIFDLHWLIGPKLYEASWQQLQEDGYIARVRCVEVWCEMSKAFFSEYLAAEDERNEALRRALWTCNPIKLKVCEYLIRFHEGRGDKVIVFSENIFILEDFAKRLGRYFICGKVDMRERMQILQAFKETASCNTIFLSKVGDNAIDIPNASVIIQISSHYGSRRQEAQRLGRILRPKPKAFKADSKYNAFFYSLVSRDTQEMFYANRRQQFLVEQGYNYHVLRDHSVQRMDRQDMAYSSEQTQLQLLKQVLESVRRGDGDMEDEEVALHDNTSASTMRQVKAEPGASGPAMMPGVSEERVSLANLSGGLDGSYSVASTVPARTVKRSDSMM